MRVVPLLGALAQGQQDMVLIPVPVLVFIIFPSIVQGPLSSLHARPPGLNESAPFASATQTWIIAATPL